MIIGMPYVEPDSVLSPKRRGVRVVRVRYDSGPVAGSWAVAEIEWDGAACVGIRWNGDDDSPIGNPQSHGRPTWFLVPRELEDAVLDRVEELGAARGGGLAAGYAEMARDRAREADADAWSEGLIGDAREEG
jgi:hypothetical protein